MTRVEDLLLRARRDILADTQATRWSNDTLLSHLTSGVNDFLLRTKVTKSSFYVTLESNIGIYTIKDYSQQIVRVQFMEKSLEIKTSKDMDTIDIEWENTIGLEPKYIIFDNLPQGTFRIYPKVIDTAISVTVANQPYGGIIDIEVTDDLFRLPTDSAVTIQNYKYLKVTYIKKQNKVTFDTALDLDTMYDDALLYYVSGMALRNDADTQNRAFGAEQLKLYDSIVAVAKGNESVSNNALSAVTTGYKGFV